MQGFPPFEEALKSQRVPDHIACLVSGHSPVNNGLSVLSLTPGKFAGAQREGLADSKVRQIATGIVALDHS